ncbi:hypothetical protein E0L36_17015 [Streptomyces sp. AJS327]|uniref:hypothetical protein n=1 Tax=Streptomyces sp. AJS327 TaxID=2545265 RepID=UPI0015DE8660|nr:hypothetical protein [Streptomyces sp. AJS327]MBA0052522.1 hypothetical protein [Streptomyces sp. AJS327]
MSRAEPTLGLLHGGSFHQLATLDDPAVRVHRPRALYLPETGPADLDGLDGLVVSDRLHPRLLRERADDLLTVAARGGTLVVLGENEITPWLPGLAEHRPAETNFWWWRTGEDPGIRVRSPRHEAWAHLSERAVVWHYHGLLRPPEGASTLVTAGPPGDGPSAILYEDRVSTPGRLIVSTMDPVYHHGSAFMPGATQLLYGLLRWITASR